MKKLLILSTVILLVVSSCEDFLTVNEFNPNTASAVPTNLVLPAALNATARNVIHPDNYRFIYVWYGCWSIASGYSQPTALTQYKLANTMYQDNWSNSYTNLQNYDYIDKMSVDARDNYFKAIAKIMKAYVYQYLVDAYGNVPYTQALKTDEGILKPEYDNQQTIYEDLVLQLDEAMGLITGAPGNANEVGEYDIVFDGDMDLWWKFANTLKLRMLLNQSGMANRSAYITGALATTSHTTADYLGVGEGAMLNPGYVKSSGKMNPFWENYYKQDDSQQPDGLGYDVAGQDACDFLNENNDPRKFRFFTPSSAGSNEVLGNYFGETILRPMTSTSSLGPGMLQAYNQDAAIMTDFESLFLQAEAVQRGLITGNAKELYENAVKSSIIFMGGPEGTAAGAATYLAQTGNPQISFDSSIDKIKTIITQKWVALNGISPMPIWTDYRRTGFPDFLHFTEDAAKLNDTPPVRMLYPQSEINVNDKNVNLQGTINAFTSKIFWQNR